MGGGGEAPPVKSDDVLILVGASLLIAAFIIHAWARPAILGSEPLVNEQDLMSGDTVKITWSGNVTGLEIVYEGEVVPSPKLGDNEVSYTADSSGTYTFTVEGDEGSEIIISTSRSLMLDWLIYPIGGVMLAYGIWKKGIISANSDDEEILEALIED